MNIRQASLSDSAGIAKVHVTSWKTTYRGQIPDAHLDQLSIPDRAVMWEKLFQQNDGEVLVVEEGPEILGFASFGKCRDADVDNRTGEMFAIYLGAQAQGVGLGRGLWEAALARLRDQGYERVCVWVLDSNSFARGFYEKMGGKLDGQSKTAIIGGKQVLELRYLVSIV